MAQLPRPRLRRADRAGARARAMSGHPATVEQFEDERLVEEIEHGGVTWYHANEPGRAVVDWLRDRFGFDELTLEDVTSTRQRPKVDEFPDVVFVILHFPLYDKRTRRLNVAEVNAFVGADYVITLPSVPMKPVDRMFYACRDNASMRARHMGKGSGYLLYEIVDELFQYCFPIVDKIVYKLDSLEDDIEDVEAHRRGRGDADSRDHLPGSAETASDILSAKLEIINYRRIMKPQRPILNHLDRTITRFLPEDLDLYFDELIDKSERIWDVLEAAKEKVEAIEDTHETLIAHRNNEQLRVLTVISVILLPLSVITGFFGMNVHFPGTGTVAGFVTSVAVLVGCFVGLIAWFRVRGWL